MNDDFLSPYKRYIEERLPGLIPFPSEKTPLQEACLYALLSGGKRLRPAIALMVAEALGNQDRGWLVGASVELFHTASLIADDLPCMDDDDERRNKRTTHKVFGETLALLASYALIAEGYGKIHEGVVEASKDASVAFKAERAGLLSLECATRNTGLLGATGGQFLDVFLKNPSEEQILEIIQKKTASLFEIAFVGGWLFAGGEEAQLDQVAALAYHFGVAFQIADDLDDFEQDGGKSQGANYAQLFGKEAALHRCLQDIDSYTALLRVLKLDTPALLSLGQSVKQGALTSASTDHLKRPPQ